MEYYENGGGATASLYWTPPGQAESLVHGDQEQNIIGDAIFLTKLSDENGKINFSWDEYQEGDLYVTVTKRNYRPYEGLISVSAPNGLAVNPDYESLNESAYPGEVINFNIPLSNIGSESVSYTHLTLPTIYSV